MTEICSESEGASSGEPFRAAVSSLAEGGIILVVSTVPDWVHQECCEQLLGSPTEPHRRVLGVATPGSAEGATERLPEGADQGSGRLRIVYNDLDVRGAATSGSGGEVNPVGDQPASPGPGLPSPDETRPQVRTVLTEADVGEFGGAINEAISDLASLAHGDLSPGELRVCVDDLATLMEREEPATVAQFVHLLGARVRNLDGILVAHATLSPDDPRAKALEAFADATVDLRLHDGEPEMQWTLSDGPTSEWIPLSWIATGTDDT